MSRFALTTISFWSAYLIYNIYNRSELSKMHAALAIHFALPAIIIFVLLISFWKQSRNLATVVMTVWSVTAGLYAAEAYLGAQCKYCKDTALPPTERLEYLRSLRAKGIPAYPTYSAYFSEGPMPVGLKGGREIYPLAGISRVRTVIGRESAGMIEYDSDEHGFRNPLGSWDKPADIVLIGDSFAEGCCVDDIGTIAGALRPHFANVVTLGRMGYGPLNELAVLREYAPALKPKAIVWAYTDINDIPDMLLEANQKIFLAYLQRGYQQGLLQRQAEIDEAVRAFIARKEEVYQAARLDLSRIDLRRFLFLRDIADLAVTRISSLTAKAEPPPAQAAPAAPPQGREPDDAAGAAVAEQARALELFGRIMTEAKATADELGARIYFVRIRTEWSAHLMHDAVHQEAMRLAAAAGLTVIDVTPELRKQKNPNAFSPPKEHYSALGYHLVADLIRRRIAEDGGL